MAQDNTRSQEIQSITGLQPKHFADLIPIAQVVVDPAVGLSGRQVQVNWQALDIPPGVVDNLLALGDRYRYSSPYVVIDQVWEQLTPETRSWFLGYGYP